MIFLLLAALLAVSGPKELRDAVKSNDAVRVRTLLNAGIDPNFRDPLGATLLHDAAWNGNQQIAELLLEYPDAKPLDLSDVYKHLAAQGRLAGFEVTERFYEIGSPGGLAEATAYLSGKTERSA